MIDPATPIDSVLLSPEPETASPHLAAANFPPLTDQRLREFLERFSAQAGDNLAHGLPSLSEPGLYALVAAVARADALEPEPRIADQFSVVVPSLLAELRRRNCRGMGTDPAGPVRRGRLLQLIGAFATLTSPGTSPREDTKLAGACPLCNAESSLQVSLPRVQWQCFSCARSGALLEFAEYLLTKVRDLDHSPVPARLQQPTLDNDPAAS